MKKYIPSKRNPNSKQRTAKARIKSEQEKSHASGKLYHKPDWMVRESFD